MKIFHRRKGDGNYELIVQKLTTTEDDYRRETSHTEGTSSTSAAKGDFAIAEAIGSPREMILNV